MNKKGEVLSDEPSLLDFEKALEPLAAEMDALRRSDEPAADILKRIADVEKRQRRLLKNVYGKLSAWQICQVARHPARPQTDDYIAQLITDFTELHGDRLFADDPALLCGLGVFDGAPAAVIGHRKGRNLNERQRRNFGMAHPEGYRKALRVMRLAEKFRLPLITFVDTPGAYPGIGAEERGQSGAIGECLRALAELRTPVVAAVIGEGGSGGALALALADSVVIMQYAVYSVISPEGCASILWKDGGRAEEAARLLAITAPELKKLKLIDEVVEEPLGAAHRAPAEAIDAVGRAVSAALQKARRQSSRALVASRARRWRSYGEFSDVGD